MTTKQIEFIIEQYRRQPIAADKLGGTLELTEMTLRYNQWFGVRATEGEILSKLIGMRKDGKLPKKTVRIARIKAKPSWPKAEKLTFKVKIEITVEFHTVCSIVDDMLALGELMPVTRQEIYDYLMKHPDSANHSGYWQDEHTELEISKIQETVFRLFPDLV